MKSDKRQYIVDLVHYDLDGRTIMRDGFELMQLSDNLHTYLKQPEIISKAHQKKQINSMPGIYSFGRIVKFSLTFDDYTIQRNVLSILEAMNITATPAVRKIRAQLNTL